MEKGCVSVVALLGSPRKQGNTDIMADQVLEGAREEGAVTLKIYIDDHQVRPIAEVADDTSRRQDSRRDDDFTELLEHFLSADIVVWATPVYWQGVSAQMKCFLDRLSSYFNSPDYRHRVTGKGHVVVCAYGSPGTDTARWVTAPMKVTAEVLGGKYLGDVHASVYRKGDVKRMAGVLSACRELGRATVRAVR